MQPLCRIAAICALVPLGLLSLAAAAQGFPNRPIRFVMPATAGSGGDIVVRTIAAKLADMWRQQVVVENRPGANQIIGAEIVAKAKPDGYTWLMGQTASLAINPALYSKLPYDAARDFDPVTQLTSYGYLLVVHPSIPVKSAKELIALGRAKPGALVYSSSGIDRGGNELIGSSPEEFARMLRSEGAKYAKLIKDTNIRPQ